MPILLFVVFAIVELLGIAYISIAAGIGRDFHTPLNVILGSEVLVLFTAIVFFFLMFCLSKNKKRNALLLWQNNV